MGETVEIDEKGRITVPSWIRRDIRSRVFKVELADKDTIILKPAEDRRRMVKRFRSLVLEGDEGARFLDAAVAGPLIGYGFLLIGDAQNRKIQRQERGQ